MACNLLHSMIIFSSIKLTLFGNILKCNFISLCVTRISALWTSPAKYMSPNYWLWTMSIFIVHEFDIIEVSERKNDKRSNRGKTTMKWDSVSNEVAWNQLKNKQWTQKNMNEVKDESKKIKREAFVLDVLLALFIT